MSRVPSGSLCSWKMASNDLRRMQGCSKLPPTKSFIWRAEGSHFELGGANFVILEEVSTITVNKRAWGYAAQYCLSALSKKRNLFTPKINRGSDSSRSSRASSKTNKTGSCASHCGGLLVFIAEKSHTRSRNCSLGNSASLRLWPLQTLLGPGKFCRAEISARRRRSTKSFWQCASPRDTSKLQNNAE